MLLSIRLLHQLVALHIRIWRIQVIITLQLNCKSLLSLWLVWWSLNGMSGKRLYSHNKVVKAIQSNQIRFISIRRFFWGINDPMVLSFNFARFLNIFWFWLKYLNYRTWVVWYVYRCVYRVLEILRGKGVFLVSGKIVEFVGLIMVTNGQS